LLGFGTAEKVRELGLVTSSETAGQILSIGRSKAYEMARHDEFPVPLMRVARKYTVSVSPPLPARCIAKIYC